MTVDEIEARSRTQMSGGPNDSILQNSYHSAYERPPIRGSPSDTEMLENVRKLNEKMFKLN